MLSLRLPQAGTVELVYLGVTVSARGGGVGDFLMDLALATAAGENRENLSLAVDSQNQPALEALLSTWTQKDRIESWLDEGFKTEPAACASPAPEGAGWGAST